MKKWKKIVLCVLLFLLVFVLAGLLTLTALEYKPADREALTVQTNPCSTLRVGSTLDVLTWNIGYAGLGAESDFFMDGGKNVQAADADTVNRYLEGIYQQLYQCADPAELIFLQEVDTDSTRTYHMDQTQVLRSGCSAFALNFNSPYIPYPMPPIGKVTSGILTSSAYRVESAERISLPVAFSWPVSTVQMKRCLLASYLPIEGTDKYLVAVNLHLEAYDDGEGKLAQTARLMTFIQTEYQKGNYVIAGGDFNQVFPGADDLYPNVHADLWSPGKLEALPEGWNYVTDLSIPTCRLLNQVYDPSDTENTQYYVIDGFIVSPNVQVNSVETLSLDFAYSDHNPVRMSFTLLPQD